MALVSTFLLAGCWGDGEPSRSPEQTARAWVDALNAEDYERACALSVVDDEQDCVELLKAEPFGKSGIKVEGFSEGGDKEGSFGISSAQDRRPRGSGWTAYAPLDGFVIERHDDEYLVHWEVSIIK